MTEPRPTRGRSGGRAGGAGYDYQDVYVAWQLARMLMGDRDPIIEVLWEKKTIDLGSETEPTFVDDAIVLQQSGNWTYTQLKESAQPRSWTARQLARSGVLKQFWDQWQVRSTEHRPKTRLQLASSGDLGSLGLVSDTAMRSRTPAELVSEEASSDTLDYIKSIADALELSESQPELLQFLKAIRIEQLPSVDDVYGWIVHTFTVFGARASDLTNHLIRIVAESKHIGNGARSSHNRDSLIESLQANGVDANLLSAAGLIPAGKSPGDAFWVDYRKWVVDSYRSFRVYGLDVEHPVIADLPSLFVPLKLLPLNGKTESDLAKTPQRRSLTESLFEDEAVRSDPVEPRAAVELSEALMESRRFVLVGSQGCGKTTIARWLAIISAMEGKEGQQIRERFGLPTEPLRPLFVRFRKLADRIRNRGLEDAGGRVGLVAEFLASEFFEVGIGTHVYPKNEALGIAQSLLNSKDTLLIFDALDEVADSKMRRKLLDAVADLLATYEHPRVVLTSRPFALREDDLRVTMPRYTPLPLTRSSRAKFCEHWYRSIRLHIDGDLSEEEIEGRIENLIHESERTPDLAESPLLLSVLALVHFNQSGIPSHRANLYDDALVAMLGHWERDPARNPGDDGIPSDWADTLGLDLPEIQRVVEYLAHDTQFGESGSEFTGSQALMSLSVGLRAVTDSSETDQKAELLLNLLVERSGVVLERSAGVFGFVHLSFQEYLAARWHVNQGHSCISELATHAKEERHAETIRFAAGLVTSQQGDHSSDLGRDFVLAVGKHNGVLAAACTGEMPGFTLGDNECEELARTMLADGGRHYRGDLVARLMWQLLEHSESADLVVLESLAQDESERNSKRRMGGELTIATLACRPPRPMSSEFEWFVRRLSKLGSWYRYHELEMTKAICNLLLVEAEIDSAQQHIGSLIYLLGDFGYSSRFRNTHGSLVQRAESTLTLLLEDDITSKLVRSALSETILKNENGGEVVSAARFLSMIGDPLSAELADSIIEASSEMWSWNDGAKVFIAELARDSGNRELIVPLLTSILSSNEQSRVDGAVSILKEIEERSPDTSESKSAFLLESWRAASSDTLLKLLEDPASADDLAAKLAEELCLDVEEEQERVWRAANVLFDSGRLSAIGLPRALVEAGLANVATRSTARDYLIRMASESENLALTNATLLDALKSESESIATGAAIVILDIGTLKSASQLKRIVSASLRHPDQVGEVASRLRDLLASGQRASAIEVMSKFLERDFDGDEFEGENDSTVAGNIALTIADSGLWDVPHLAFELVVQGLSQLDIQNEVIDRLHQMLEDADQVTNVRRGLSFALEGDNTAAAWGATSCLWNAGLRYDPKLACGIIKGGLESGDGDRLQQARAMFEVLFSESRTASHAAAALRDCVQKNLEGYRSEPKLAWYSAERLLSAGVVDADYVPEALVLGGLSDEQSRQEAIGLARQAVKSSESFSESLQSQLWKSIQSAKKPDAGSRGYQEEKEARELGWLALEALAELFPSALRDAILKSEEAEKTRAVVRLLLIDGTNKSNASTLLGKLTKLTEHRDSVEQALKALLVDDDESVAFEAASLLAKQENFEHGCLPMAVISGGLGNFSNFERAEHILDALRNIPAMEIPLCAALNSTLWGDREQAAWRAAVFLMDRGDDTLPGIARALVFGGLIEDWHVSRADTVRRLRVLLEKTDTREMAIDGLKMNLFPVKDHHGFNFAIASILVIAGVDVSEALALGVDEEIRWSPFSALAMIAMSGEIDRFRSSAKRIGSTRLIELIGDSNPD